MTSLIRGLSVTLSSLDWFDKELVRHNKQQPNESDKIEPGRCNAIQHQNDWLRTNDLDTIQWIESRGSILGFQ